MIRTKGMAVLFLLALFAAVGCSLPDDVINSAKTTEKKAVDTEKALLDKLAKYRDTAASPDFEFFKPYAEREGWDDVLLECATEAYHAKAKFDKKTGALGKLLDKNDEDDAGKVRQLLSSIKSDLTRAERKSRGPAQRMGKIENAKKKAPKIMTKARGEEAHASNLTIKLIPHLTDIKVKWPIAAKKIDERFAVIKAHNDRATGTLVQMEKQFMNHNTDKFVDYAVIADGGDQVTVESKDVVDKDKYLRGQAKTLNGSMSKTLVDMRVDCAISIGRTSWDNFYDFPTEHTHTYRTRIIPCETADYFAQVGEGALATYGSGWGGGLSVKVDQTAWNKLGIDEKEGWSSGDDGAEYWVADWPNRYYHKYVIIKNGVKTETDWVGVEEDEYEEYEDDMGMDIESKPYGTFEDETLEEAAPPGLANVGNEAYGKWENDGHGGRHWTFFETYLFYSMLLGPRYHYGYGMYTGYNSYRSQPMSRRNGYYGKGANGKRSFGTYGSQTRQSSRMGRSNFSKRGGFKNAGGASVRGAGLSFRGGGPGGGGK